MTVLYLADYWLPTTRNPLVLPNLAPFSSEMHFDCKVLLLAMLTAKIMVTSGILGSNRGRSGICLLMYKSLRGRYPSTRNPLVPPNAALSSKKSALRQQGITFGFVDCVVL